MSIAQVNQDTFSLCTYRKTSDRSRWLLSVQMWIRLPACMRGPASVTTCQLCVILLKNHQPLCTSTSILYVFTMHYNTKTAPVCSYRTGNLPRLVCWTLLVTGAQLLSVQMNQTSGQYGGPASIRVPISVW